MKNKRIIIYVAILAVLFALSIFVYDEYSDDFMSNDISDTDKTSDDKQLAPNFIVTDTNGNIVNFSDFTGKPSVINFWASWCGPCKQELPYFDSIYQDYGDKINVLMVNLTDGIRETADKARSYIADSGYSFNVYFDTENDVGDKYYLGSIPLTVFVDRDGYIYSGHVGVISEIALKHTVEALIDEKE